MINLIKTKLKQTDITIYFLINDKNYNFDIGNL